MNRSLLVIVDVQRGFVNRWTAAIPAKVEALQHRFGVVAATRFINPEGSMHRRLMGWTRFAPDSAEAGLAFAPRADAPVFDKTGYTILTPEFRAWLDAQGAARVHLAGIATDNCVLKSAVDLFEAGIEPVVLVDHCASHGGPKAQAAGLLLLGRFIGKGQLRETSSLA